MINSLLSFSEETELPDEEKVCKGVIYRITNKENGLIYIGKTNKSFRSRYGAKWWESTHNRMLKADVAIFGKDAFSVDIFASGLDPENLVRYEAFSIHSHNCLYPNGYNLKKDVSGPGIVSEATRKLLREKNGGRKHSEKTKKKISAAHKGVAKNNLKGVPKSKEHRAKIAASRIGKKWNKESREKMTGANNARSKAVAQLHPQTGIEIKRFPSIGEASREIKINDTAIIRVCKGKNKTAAGYGWKYTT